MELPPRLWFYGSVSMRSVSTETRRGRGYGRYRRRRRGSPILLVLFLLFLLGLAYLFLPIGTQRAVLLGSDARADEAARSDTIMVAATGWDNGMLSVPRDTLVPIPGAGDDKVNAALATGGPELAVETLEGFTGYSIGNYVAIDFNGVQEIVEAMGGITVTVDEPIELGTEDGQYYSIAPGTQTLDGGEALAYVRYRGGADADIGRVGRQQQFMQALGSQAFSPGNLHRLPQTYRAILANVETNMNPVEATRFAIQLRISGGGTTATYPGSPQYIDGISYWIPDTAAGQQVVEETLD